MCVNDLKRRIGQKPYCGVSYLAMLGESDIELCRILWRLISDRIYLSPASVQIRIWRLGNMKDQRNVAKPETIAISPANNCTVTLCGVANSWRNDSPRKDSQLPCFHITARSYLLTWQALSSWCFEFEISQEDVAGDGGAPKATLLSVPVVCGVRLSVQVWTELRNLSRPDKCLTCLHCLHWTKSK